MLASERAPHHSTNVNLWMLMMSRLGGRSDPDSKKKKEKSPPENHPNLGRVQFCLLLSIYSGFPEGF